MAGGDGSQAIVATVASEAGLHAACVPSGTRNHFALDLGVDRDDVVGRSTRLVDAGERRVDLGEVNGRVFVNNVSLGLYAEAVQRSGYRDAKLRTILDTILDVLGPEGDGPAIRWTGPGGHEHHEAAAILVSNNRYRPRAAARLRHPSADRRRAPRHCRRRGAAGPGEGDAPQRPWRDWSEATFEVDADRPVPAELTARRRSWSHLFGRDPPGALRTGCAPALARRPRLGFPREQWPAWAHLCGSQRGAIRSLLALSVSATLHFRRKTLYFLKLRQGS